MLRKLIAAVAIVMAGANAFAVDVNKATSAELDGVKGIGPVTSKLILEQREKGSFKNWEDFTSRVKGIGDARAARLSAEGLTVNGSALAAAPAGTAAASRPAAERPRAATR